MKEIIFLVFFNLIRLCHTTRVLVLASCGKELVESEDRDFFFHAAARLGVLYFYLLISMS